MTAIDLCLEERILLIFLIARPLQALCRDLLVRFDILYESLKGSVIVLWSDKAEHDNLQLFIVEIVLEIM